MRLKSQKPAVLLHVRNGTQQGLPRRLVLKGDQEQLVVAVRIGELHASVHPEFQRRRQNVHARLDFNPFVGLVLAPLSELAVADDVHPYLIDFHLFDRGSFRSHLHREGCHHVFGGRGLVIERDHRHELLPLSQFNPVSIRETGFGQFQAGAAEEEGLSRTGNAFLVGVEHEDMVEVLLRQRLPILCEHSGFVADEVHVFGKLEGVFGHAGSQIAVVWGWQVNGPERQRDGIAFNGDVGGGLILQGRNGVIMAVIVCREGRRHTSKNPRCGHY